MRILVTNDDGVHADGLFALQSALRQVGEVVIVAPERPQSASGHAITLHKPLRLSPTTLRDGTPAFASNGTPSDCTTLGILEASGGEVDLVVSGINHGPNLGWDAHYSGTVSAAIEAAIIGKPAFAISVAEFAQAVHWGVAASFAAKIAQQLSVCPLPAHTLLNVNVPNVKADAVRGVAVTTQGSRQYVDRIEKREDPLGRPYFWLGGSLAEEARGAEPGTDVRAVADGFISVTPIQLDMTAYAVLPALKKWAQEGAWPLRGERF
jgi:5'-nucleotidase